MKRREIRKRLRTACTAILAGSMAVTGAFPGQRAVLEAFAAENGEYAFEDDFISFTVPESGDYVVEQRNSQFGLAYAAGLARPDDSLFSTTVNCAVTQVDLNLLAGVAENGLDQPGYEALFDNLTDIVDISCEDEGETYEFTVDHYMADTIYTDYVKYIGIDQSQGLGMRIYYSCAGDEDGETGGFLLDFYDSFELKLPIGICASVKAVAAPKIIYARYDLSSQMRSLDLEAARNGRAYLSEMLTMDQAAANLEKVQQEMEQLPDYSPYAGYQPYEQVRMLKEYVRSEMTDSVRTIIGNLMFIADLSESEVADTASVLAQQQEETAAPVQEEAPADDSAQVQTPPAQSQASYPPGTILYWSQNMKFTYSGTWYDSANDFTVYMPTSWKRTPVTTKTLQEGIELQLSDSNRGISLSIYCGPVAYSPTVEGIYQYVTSIGSKNVNYAVCNGNQFAVQFDSGTTPERQIAFPNSKGEVVTLAVYCENQAMREAFAFDLFSSVFGKGAQ